MGGELIRAAPPDISMPWCRPMTRNAPRPRHALLISTALAMTACMCPPLAAQNLPSGYTLGAGTPTITLKDGGGTSYSLGAGTAVSSNNAVTTTNASAETVTLNDSATIINWDSFNVGAGKQLTFASSLAAPTVLNRVTGSSTSLIDGSISATGVNVWLVNPSGIVFSSTGSFSGGSLVVSTAGGGAGNLGIQDADFLAGGSYPLSGATTNPINLQLGSSISGTNFIAVGQNIASSGSINVTGQVALIAARDAVLTTAPGSPLGVEITAGTQVGSALVSNGQITAQSITLMGAGTSGGADAAALLINLGGTLTASSVDGKIFIGTTTSALNPTSAKISAAGNSGDGVVLTDDTALTAQSVELGSAIDGAHALTITGDARLDGILGGTSPLDSLSISGTSALNGGAITTSGTQTYGGAVTLGMDTTLAGGGLIRAKGAIDGAHALTITGGSIRVDGDITTLNTISLDSPGSISLAGLATTGADQDIRINQNAIAPGAVSIAGDVSATGGLLVKGTAVTLGGTSSHIQQALGAISVVATSGSISKDTGGLTLQANAGGLSGGALTLDAGTNAIALGTGANAATLLGGTAGHLSDVVLRGDAGITAGTIAARSLQTVGNAAMLTAGGAITLGDLTLSQPSYIQTTGAGSMLTVGSVTVGNVAAPALLANSLTLETLGANSDIVANTASGQALTAEGNVTLRAAGNIRLGAAEAKTGGVSLTAGGDITGMILGAAASDGRVAPAYGRANVAADAANQTVTITAANGLAQLGEVTAGSGGALAAPSFDQLVVSAKAIDALSVVAANGRLSLSASTNDLTLGSGLAADDATLVAQGNLAVGTLTSSFGNISATAVTGNVTGLALATPISDGRVSTGFGLAGFAAPSTGKAITITAGGLAQLGAITTGSNGAITVRSNQIYLGDQVQATSGTIDLINRADVGPANITAVGDGLVDIAPGSFVLSNAQIGRLSASNVFITTEQAAGVIQNVSLGQFVLGAGTG